MNETPQQPVQPTDVDLAMAARDLGLEAIKLLDTFPCHDMICDEKSDEWEQKRQKLLECWQVNAADIRIKSLTSGRGGKEIEVRLVSNPFKAFFVRSKSELLDIGEIEQATRDSEVFDFQGLTIKGGNAVCVVRKRISDNTIETDPIALVSEVPPWMQSLKS